MVVRLRLMDTSWAQHGLVPAWDGGWPVGLELEVHTASYICIGSFHNSTVTMFQVGREMTNRVTSRIEPGLPIATSVRTAQGWLIERNKLLPPDGHVPGAVDPNRRLIRRRVY